VHFSAAGAIVGTVQSNTVTAVVREQEAPVGSSIAITRADDRPVVPVTAINVNSSIARS